LVAVDARGRVIVPGIACMGDVDLPNLDGNERFWSAARRCGSCARKTFDIIGHVEKPAARCRFGLRCSLYSSYSCASRPNLPPLATVFRGTPSCRRDSRIAKRSRKRSNCAREA
jgi:hypothetical protein